MGRRSHLQAPIMLLAGHGGDVYSMKFHKDGKVMASSSFDKTLLLWNVYGDCENYMVIKGHTNAVLEVQWMPDGIRLLSCSADKTVHVYDASNGQRLKKCHGHNSYVNSCCPSRRHPDVFVSGSDDTTAKVWDARVKGCVRSLKHQFSVTAVAFGEESHQIFTGGLDNDIRMWDLRKGDEESIALTLQGHADTVTGLSLSPDGSYVLSNSMDSTVRIFDVRPYAPVDRCVKVFQGAQHNAEHHLLRCAWSPDGQRVAAGSADRCVWIWDTTTRTPLYKLPGHTGSVTEVQFHPKEAIIGSCSIDKNIYLGEIKK
eukprot:TRINITY_DN7431_c0_g1_i1.p1 TRINITY_DN7431_c0_g1~~TRINITY_DN7431_c0_g1_i1.p1  ORF type:complete len:342 (+),score=83.25 TRINITY_DN7431_c0_g1_i1:86-1027(+)